MKKILAVANWKMFPRKGTDAKKIFDGIKRTATKLKHVETVVCPPFVYLESLGERVETRNCVLGAQDAFWEHEGAFTGSVSPDMVFAAKARYVILGHSERRALGDTDEIISKKLSAVLLFPLSPIVCVGELTRDTNGAFVHTVRQQVSAALSGRTPADIARMIFAYEPVWAIGGTAKRACTPSESREMISIIRQELAKVLGDEVKAGKVSVLYGGSVNEENVEGFVLEGGADGFLVGRASQDAKTFSELLRRLERVGKK